MDQKDLDLLLTKNFVFVDQTEEFQCVFCKLLYKKQLRLSCNHLICRNCKNNRLKKCPTCNIYVECKTTMVYLEGKIIKLRVRCENKDCNYSNTMKNFLEFHKTCEFLNCSASSSSTFGNKNEVLQSQAIKLLFQDKFHGNERRNFCNEDNINNSNKIKMGEQIIIDQTNQIVTSGSAEPPIKLTKSKSNFVNQEIPEFDDKKKYHEELQINFISENDVNQQTHLHLNQNMQSMDNLNFTPNEGHSKEMCNTKENLHNNHSLANVEEQQQLKQNPLNFSNNEHGICNGNLHENYPNECNAVQTKSINTDSKLQIDVKIAPFTDQINISRNYFRKVLEQIEKTPSNFNEDLQRSFHDIKVSELMTIIEKQNRKIAKLEISNHFILQRFNEQTFQNNTNEIETKLKLNSSDILMCVENCKKHEVWMNEMLEMVSKNKEKLDEIIIHINQIDILKQQVENIGSNVMKKETIDDSQILKKINDNKKSIYDIAEEVSAIKDRMKLIVDQLGKQISNLEENILEIKEEYNLKVNEISNKSVNDLSSIKGNNNNNKIEKLIKKFKQEKA